MLPSLTIVVPCYNEEKNIPVFFPQLLAFAQEHNYMVIAVNDGSNDQTEQELSRFSENSELAVLSHKCNRGYGAALKTGLSATATDFAITIDADGQHLLEDVKKCFESIKEKNADLLVGARTNNVSGGYRTIGKWLIRLFASSLLELPVKDLNSGMKCYRMSESKMYFDLCPDTMAFSDVILLLMVNDRKRVVEIPIKIASRLSGASTIGNKTALITIAEILNLAVLLRPLTTFFRLGLVFMILGLIWSTFTYLKSCTVSSTAGILMIFGLFCFVLGILCEQLSQLRLYIAKLKYKG